jgi:hypothetical protein
MIIKILIFIFFKRILNSVKTELLKKISDNNK